MLSGHLKQSIVWKKNVNFQVSSAPIDPFIAMMASLIVKQPYRSAVSIASSVLRSRPWHMGIPVSICAWREKRWLRFLKIKNRWLLSDPLMKIDALVNSMGFHCSPFRVMYGKSLLTHPGLGHQSSGRHDNELSVLPWFIWFEWPNCISI